MDKRILAHEKMMREKIKNGRLDKETLEYHKWMVANFQHERLVHLIVMFSFVGLTFALIIISCLMSFSFGLQYLWPIYVATLAMVVVTGFYVRYYYFLENHIQRLYELWENN